GTEDAGLALASRCGEPAEDRLGGLLVDRLVRLEDPGGVCTVSEELSAELAGREPEPDRLGVMRDRREPLDVPGLAVAADMPDLGAGNDLTADAVDRPAGVAVLEDLHLVGVERDDLVGVLV